MTSSLPSLSSLLSRTAIADNSELLKAANATLKKSKNDATAQHVKLVALTKLDRIDEAAKFLEGNSSLKESARLEYAYILYKSGNYEAAVKAASNGPVSAQRGLRHVFAQANYRLENFESTAESYRQLGAEAKGVENEENDIRINNGAVDAQLQWQGRGSLVTKKQPSREDLEAFETAYNAACGSIARGELAHGEFLLKRAYDLCNALDDLSDEEKLAETLPITVQQVYVLCCLGKFEEASKLSNALRIADIQDLSTRLVAQVNAICTENKPENPYLSHRLYHSSPTPGKSDGLFNFQQTVLRQNDLSLDLLSKKYSGLLNSTNSILASHKTPVLSSAVNVASLSNISAKVGSQPTPRHAIKEILPFLEQRPDDVGLILMTAHLYVLTSNYAAAVSLIESFFTRLEKSEKSSDLDIRYSPGLVALLASIYKAQSRKASIREELRKASSFWKKKAESKPKEDIPLALLRAAGASLLESEDRKDLEDASSIYTILSERDPSSPAVAAGLVASNATVYPERISQKQLSALPDTSRVTEKIDAVALEDAGVAKTKVFALSSIKKRPAADKDKSPRPKKIRKSRMPKDFVESKKMDPERWMPMRDRSYYRPKGKKGKKKQEALTQGGVVAEEKASGTETPKQVVGGGNQKKKKKGKGGKR